MSVETSDPVFKNGVLRWVDARLPVLSWGYNEFMAYPAPRNLNYWWNFGSLAGFCLVVQILTGIVLSMHYNPSAAASRNSRRA